MAVFAAGATRPATSLLLAALLQHRSRSATQKNDIFIGLGILSKPMATIDRSHQRASIGRSRT